MAESGTRLRRAKQGRMVAGVCAGIGGCYDLDPNLVRLGFAVLAIFGGIGILLYPLAWLIIPDEGEDASLAEHLFDSLRR